MKDSPTRPLSGEERLHLTLQIISDRKAQDIVGLDLRPLNYLLCDYFVVATAESDRQAQAIADALLEHFKEVEGRHFSYRMEGYETGKWILVDMGDIVVHLLQPELRAYYRLEELWGDAKSIPYA